MFLCSYEGGHLQISQDLHDNKFFLYSKRVSRVHGHERAAPAMRARRDGSKMERGQGKPHHGQEAAVEARDFAGDERGTVAVVEA
jgi:hypothetical protein